MKGEMGIDKEKANIWEWQKKAIFHIKNEKTI